MRWSVVKLVVKFVVKLNRHILLNGGKRHEIWATQGIVTTVVRGTEYYKGLRKNIGTNIGTDIGGSTYD